MVVPSKEGTRPKAHSGGVQPGASNSKSIGYEKSMTTSSPTPYPDLNAVLHELVSSVRDVLGDDVQAVYLQGSFAVGDFDGDSDVDFLIAIREELSDAQLAAVQAMHEQIYDLPILWAQHLEGSYFSKDDLKRYDPKSEQPWYLDNGSRVLIRSHHDNTQVVRWVTREHGIPLFGPDPKTLIDPVSANDLKAEVRTTMREWGHEIIANPVMMDSRWYQTFAVVMYCRMLQTLQTGTVESKRAGAEWGKNHLDPRWSGLIQRAWGDRPDPSSKARQAADPDELNRTVEFIRYALRLSEPDA
jgi:predicted nucleotidyltransferase